MRWCEEEESQGLPRGQASQQTYFFSFALFPAISSFAAAPSLEPRPRRQAPAASGGGRQASWSPHRREHRPVQPTPAFFSTRNTKTAFVQPEICTGSGNVLNPAGISPSPPRKRRAGGQMKSPTPSPLSSIPKQPKFTPRSFPTQHPAFKTAATHFYPPLAGFSNNTPPQSHCQENKSHRFTTHIINSYIPFTSLIPIYHSHH